MRKARFKPPPQDAEVDAIRDALVELRRLLQRRELVELWAAAFGRSADLDYGELRLLDAIAVASAPPGERGARGSDRRGGERGGRGEPRAAGATVGEVARLLGIDPSRASRQIARAVAKGLLRRSAAQADARAVVLRVTARGQRLQAQGRDLTRARIALAISAWPAADRARFAARFAQFVAALRSPGGATGGATDDATDDATG